jgi:carbon-monoxide dehydrogenase small subunit
VTTETVALVVNGARHEVDGLAPTDSLSHVLRDRLCLTGTKEACGEGWCGACSVLLGDRLVCSCLVPAANLDGAVITTIEGLDDALAARVREALVAAGGVQCGYCTPGIVLAIHTRLRDASPPEDGAIAGHLCRCTGYGRILAALDQLVREAG